MPTPQEIISMAQAEGVTLGVRMGRVTARGCSPVLGQLLIENERQVVESLGGEFRPPWLDLFSERKSA